MQAAHPTVRLFGRPFTWHIFISPVGLGLVLVFISLVRRQAHRIRNVLWLQRIWREEMARRYAGLDRAYWPDRQR